MTFFVALLALLLGLVVGFVIGCTLTTVTAIEDKNFRNYLNAEGSEYDNPFGINE